MASSPSSSTTLLGPRVTRTTTSFRQYGATRHGTPLSNSYRHKPRRWPLVLRFCKGSIHSAVFIPVVLHSLFAVLINYLDANHRNLGVPPSITPSLSLVVGLMLVFRNQTSYDRFWTGRTLLTECCTCVRNLSRSLLVSSTTVELAVATNDGTQEFAEEAAHDLEFPVPSEFQRADTEQAIKLLVATLYAIKHNLRNEYLTTADGEPIHASSHPDFEALLPASVEAAEYCGLSFPLQLMVMLEAYFRRCLNRNWINGPQACALSSAIDTLTSAYGRMEAIKTTPIPVAHLIHTKQVLALYGAVLPFSLVNGFGWWCVPMVAVLMFTLYGIDGIGKDLEDPFGYDKNDIKMDAIVEDARVECFVLLEMWKDRVTVEGAVDAEGMFK